MKESPTNEAYAALSDQRVKNGIQRVHKDNV